MTPYWNFSVFCKMLNDLDNQIGRHHVIAKANIGCHNSVQGAGIGLHHVLEVPRAGNHDTLLVLAQQPGGPACRLLHEAEVAIEDVEDCPSGQCQHVCPPQ